MKLRTVVLIALVAVPASFSGSASSNAPIATAPIAQTGATCAAVVRSAAVTITSRRNLCSRPIVVAQTQRANCIKNCQNIYSGGGEPLQNCIKQCPAE